MPTEAQIAHRYTERALQLIRVGNGQAEEVRRELRALAGELQVILASVVVSSLGRRALGALLADVQAAIAGRYAAIAAQQQAAVAELVVIEADWARRVSEFPRPASARALDEVADRLLVQGTPLAQQWARQQGDLIHRVAGAVREVAAGQAPGDGLISRVLGTGPGAAGSGSGGIIQASARNADSLVHTTVSEAATDARLPVWRANGVNAFRWHAVLDEKTTAGCALRHGLVYTLDTLEPINHNIPIEREPPRHYRCRSILLPMAYDSDIPVPADGGQARFREYFDGLSESQQDRLFGEGRAALFRRGVITQADLVNQGGQLLTLGELRESGIFSAYDEAVAGSRYAGDLRKLREMSDREVLRSRQSYRRQIDRHRSWIEDPFGTGKLPDGFDNERAADLRSRFWPRNIELLEERLNVVQGVMRERGIGP